jgi:hypothetical protein
MFTKLHPWVKSECPVENLASCKSFMQEAAAESAAFLKAAIKLSPAAQVSAIQAAAAAAYQNDWAALRHAFSSLPQLRAFFHSHGARIEI